MIVVAGATSQVGALAASLAAGELAIVGEDFERLTGRSPRTVREIGELHAAALPLSGRART